MLTKFRNLHVYFFYLFLFSIPFQTRKVFLTEYSFYSGAFTEYATFFVYLSDIFLILTLFFWFISSKILIKRFDSSKINIKFASKKSKLCHSCVSWNSGLNSKYNFLKYDIRSFLEFFKSKNQVWKYLLLFVLVLCVNLIFKRYYPEISFFQFLKLLEAILLFIYVCFNLKNRKILFNSIIIFSFSGFIQGIIAIKQFIIQSSVFYNFPILRKIIGESLIGVDVPGVAKFIFEGQKIVRSYGTFPHPNILAGFLIFTILITIFLYLESKNGYLSSKISNFRLFSQYNNTKSNISQGLLYSLFWVVLIFVQISALLLTFSRISWIGFILAVTILLLLYVIYFSIVSRETISMSSYSLGDDNLSIVKQNFKNSPFERGSDVYEESQNYNLKLKIRNILSFFFNTLRYFQTKAGEFNKPSLTHTYQRENQSLFSDKGRLRGVYEESQGYSINSDKIVSRETILSKVINFYGKISNLTIHYKELAVVSVLLIYLIIFNFSIIQARISGNLFNSSSLPNNYAISDRSFYNNVSRETISENFILGSGLGTSIFQINGYLEKNNIKQELKPWQYQPTHNIYFLIASEIGLVGLLILLLFVGYAVSNSIRQILKPITSPYKDVIEIVSRETIEKSYFFHDKRNCKNFTLEKGMTRSGRGASEISQNYSLKSKSKIVSRETILNKKLNYFFITIFISFLFIGLFDHYFWIFQQGRLMFWLVLGLMLANSNIISKENKAHTQFNGLT